MSSVAQRPEVAAQPPPQRAGNFEYGWRAMVKVHPDGTTEDVQIPLTLDDVLHPQFGDVILESTLHDRVRDYLADVFRACTYHDPTALVISDTGVFWDDPALRHHVPDVGAIFGVRNRDTNRKSFVVAAEGVRPRVMVEIVSPDTRENDVDKKFVAYHQARVPCYVILDRLTDNDPWQLRGYQYAPGKYQEMPKDERGRLWLGDIGVWLATDGPKVICYDGVTDEPIGDYRQTRQQFLEARTQAEAEKARADAAVQARQADATRIQELEAELARLRNAPSSG